MYGNTEDNVHEDLQNTTTTTHIVGIDENTNTHGANPSNFIPTENANVSEDITQTKYPSTALNIAITNALQDQQLGTTEANQDKHNIPIIAPTVQDSLQTREIMIANEKLLAKPMRNPNGYYPPRLLNITFEWITLFIFRAFRKPPEMKDVYDLKPVDKVGPLTKQFAKHWDAKAKKSKFSIFRILNQMFGIRFILLGGIFKFLSDCCSLVSPFFLSFILQYITDLNSTYQGYLWAGGLFLILLVQNILQNHYFNFVMVVGMRIRSVLIAQIFQKAIVLSSKSRQKRTTGEIVNYMSIDTQKIGDACQFLHFAWSGLFQIAVILVFLFVLLGWVAIVGVVVMFSLIPFNAVIIKLYERFRRATLKYTDMRVKIMNEVLQGIRIIKFFSWENPFQGKITRIRKNEVIQFANMSGVRAIMGSVLMASPLFVSVSTFIVYVLVYGEGALTPQVIFPALAYFNLLRFPLLFFPMVISFAVEAAVSLSRIQGFLMEEEAEEVPLSEDPNIPIQIDDCSFKWEVVPESEKRKKKNRKVLVSLREKREKKKLAKDIEKERKMLGYSLTKIEDHKPKQPIDENAYEAGKLDHITLNVTKGELIMIIGGVGSGKSSILSAILGEMKLHSGSIKVSPSMAYTPQTSWIQNNTIRNNILFGKPFQEQRYQEVIRVCALEKDLELFPAGDLEEVGESGINLSGGQRQRISLARAAYSDAEVYLFDDPLSAVDANVANILFNQCINGILASKTRILVTHQLQFLSQADRIIILDEGKIIEQGTYEELSAVEDGYLSLFIKEKRESENETVADIDKIAPESPTEEVAAPHNPVNEAEQLEKGKLMSMEERKKGKLEFKVIWAYIQSAGGLIPLAIILALFIVAQAGLVSADYWLTLWSQGVITSQLGLSVGAALGIYASLGVAAAIIVFFRDLSLLLIGLVAASRLHNKVLNRILKAPVYFYDTTPLGRIISRFSKDQENVDTTILIVMSQFLSSLFQCIAIFVVIAIAVYWFLIALVPIMILYLIFQGLYRRASRELKRLDSLTRSPLYSHFSESLTGISTIKAYRAQKLFAATNLAYIDLNQRPYYLQIMAQRWLGLRLDLLGAIIVGVTSFLALALRTSISPAQAGLALTYALQATNFLSWLVRQATEVEINMNAVERLVFYATEVPQEPPAVIANKRPTPSWPENGSIEFQNVSMRYRPNLPLVLHDLNIAIPAGSKIGIVGRTGAGKSSLHQCLFRMVASEPESKIFIDGVNIYDIGMHDLRSRIAIIPQESTLFSGTIRTNLDPFREHDDISLWLCLEQAHLKDLIEKLPGRLDAEVAEHGANFSQGERQLICLARALARNSKILVLDEATASVDRLTDEKIQVTIRTAFKNCTVLTIAHRLNTIADYDKIVVMKQGRMAEFDTVANLLRDENSQFYSMVRETGEANLQSMMEIALQREQNLSLMPVAEMNQNGLQNMMPPTKPLLYESVMNTNNFVGEALYNMISIPDLYTVDNKRAKWKMFFLKKIFRQNGG